MTGELVTYRRALLDERLAAHAGRMRGVVVDLGGKRDRKRGAFRPAEAGVRAWWHVNIARDTRPDVFADVTRVPLAGGVADCVICTEVLEHLPDPAACVAQAHRLLKPGGVMLASVPFLYPVHADPYDFQRYAPEGLRRLFRDFASVDVQPMGGYPGVLALFLELGSLDLEGWRPWRGARRRAMLALAAWLRAKDRRSGAQPAGWRAFSTGYFVVAVR